MGLKEKIFGTKQERLQKRKETTTLKLAEREAYNKAYRREKVRRAARRGRVAASTSTLSTAMNVLDAGFGGFGYSSKSPTPKRRQAKKYILVEKPTRKRGTSSKKHKRKQSNPFDFDYNTDLLDL